MNEPHPARIEPIDAIPGDPSATEWRRAARRHQAEWRVRRGYPVGVANERRSKKDKEAGKPLTTRPIGSRVDEAFARTTGCNFITTEALAAVRHRLAHRQDLQTLDERRLYCDLLSSMPLCFNLFGPAWSDPDFASALVERHFPDMAIPGAAVRIEFEWSPSRRNPAYLGDRTAFDAVIHVGPEAGGHLIGIETKYHEYPLVARRMKDAPIPKRYQEVSEAAGLFASADGVARVWGTKTEQVWRDHLLALACRQHPDGPSKVKYVLVAPDANPPWRPLVEDYRSVLSNEMATTVDYLSLEALLNGDSRLPHANEMRIRYLPTPNAVL